VFLFEPSWKKPYSGHATRQSLEIYSRLALAGAQQRYDDVIGDFPIYQHDRARLGLVARFYQHPSLGRCRRDPEPSRTATDSRDQARQALPARQTGGRQGRKAISGRRNL
jgi:hypothetical protein